LAATARPGDGDLTFDPLLTESDATCVFEGFEPLRANPRAQHRRHRVDHEQRKQWILDAIAELGHDPRNLPRDGKRAGSPVKASVWARFEAQNPPRMTSANFERAWKQLRSSGLIAES
jgi:hypothetical protein